MIREFTTPVGTDLESIALTGSHILGIQIDNPSGSWLRVTGIEQYVPPFTIGWSYPAVPAAASLSVRFTASPSGTPSASTGGPVVVKIGDEPVAPSIGQPSGAAEYQQPGRGDVLYTFQSFTLIDTALTIGATLTPPSGFRFIPISLTVAAGIASAAIGQHIRTPVQVNLIDGFGAQLFPPIVISPELPMVGPLDPTPRQLGIGGTIEYSGLVAPGGGRVAIDTYLVYYAQEG